MAKQVFTTEEIMLEDGTKVALKPCRIARLRRFMDAFGKIAEVKTEGESLDVMVKCAGIALVPEITRICKDSKTSIDLEEPLEDFDGEFTASYKEGLEETLDIDSIHKILEVCGKLKMNDPKLEDAVKEAMKNMAQDGTTLT